MNRILELFDSDRLIYVCYKLGLRDKLIIPAYFNINGLWIKTPIDMPYKTRIFDQ